MKYSPPSHYLNLGRLTAFALSLLVTASAWAAKPTAPTAPSILTATAVSSSGINLSWRDNASNESGYYVDRSTSASGTFSRIATLGVNATSYASTGLSAGTPYYYRVSAYNNRGSSGYVSASATTLLATAADTTAPSVSLTAPTGGSTVSGTITLSASASDNVGVTKVEFYRNGTLAGSDTASPYSLGFSTTTVANGSHSFYAKAYDAAGRVGTSATVTVTVNNTTSDTTAPTVSLTVPLNGSTVSGTITLSATATDNVGVTKVEFYRDGALAGTDTASPYSLGLSTTTLANGSHSFYAKAYDAAGNVRTSTTATVTVSNTQVAPSTWVQRFGGTGSDVGGAVVLDGAGNIYMAGSFSSSITLGSTVLNTAGGRDLFLAKFSSDGTCQWAKRFGTSGDEYVTSMVLDSSGNIFLGGYFGGTGSFGGSSTLSAGGWDYFIAKYSSQGAYLWSRTVGGTSDEVITSIALDLAQANVLVTGHFQGTVNFTVATIASADTGTDSFLAKYSAANGTPVWAKNFPNRGWDTGIAVMVDKSDNILLAGYFGTRIDFGGGILYAAGTTGLNDIYLAKYTPTGSVAPTAPVWSKRYGGTRGESAYAAGLDANGDLVVGGTFSTETDLGGGTIVGTGMDTDIFLAKYSGVDGSHKWSRGLLCTLGGTTRSIRFDSLNNPVVCGYFYGACNFGAQTWTSAGSWDVFVAKYSGSNGTPAWAERFGGTGGDDCSGIVVDGANYSVTAGSFSGNANFGGTSLTSAGLGDAFLLRLDP